MFTYQIIEHLEQILFDGRSRRMVYQYRFLEDILSTFEKKKLE